MRFDKLVSTETRRRMREIARDFRKEPQPGEAVLWTSLRNRQLLGLKFRRQQPIGSFVVDFYCDDAALVVEVDGPIHEYQREADQHRQEVIESLGLGVARVSSDLVMTDISAALARIEEALEKIANPSPHGRGARGEGIAAP